MLEQDASEVTVPGIHTYCMCLVPQREHETLPCGTSANKEIKQAERSMPKDKGLIPSTYTIHAPHLAPRPGFKYYFQIISNTFFLLGLLELSWCGTNSIVTNIQTPKPIYLALQAGENKQ